LSAEESKGMRGEVKHWYRCHPENKAGYEDEEVVMTKQLKKLKLLVDKLLRLTAVMAVYAFGMQTQIGLIERQMPSQRSCQTLHTSE
jgi:hypothetical protein